MSRLLPMISTFMHFAGRSVPAGFPKVLCSDSGDELQLYIKIHNSRMMLSTVTLFGLSSLSLLCQTRYCDT